VPDLSWDDSLALVWSIANGDKRQELEALRRELVNQKVQIDGMTGGIQATDPGPTRDRLAALQQRAWSAYMASVSTFNEAAVNHNQISAEIARVSMGLYDPGKVDMTLRQLPVLGWIAIVAVSMAAALAGLAMVIDSCRSKTTEVRGYMDQFAGILNAGGGIVDQVGVLVGKSTWALLAVAAVAAAYVGFKGWRGARL
jgi:hypothetical protein